jgi:Glycosyltransferase sugar-binding region containing DXD motif
VRYHVSLAEATEELADRAERADRADRADRAKQLADRLRDRRVAYTDVKPPGGVLAAAAPPGGAVSPAGEAIPAPTLRWLRRKVGAQVYTPGYEQELARRIGPDLFGLLRLPPPPPFLAPLDLAALPPAHIAPLLARISLTQPAPAPRDLSPHALAARPGALSTHHRTPAQRHWAQPPGAPLLPAATTIPHLIHGIWLGTPVNPDSRYARNFARTARHHPHAAVTIWTDIPRAAFQHADQPPPPPGQPDPRKPHRDMLAWARANNIHLVNIHEVFHARHPMTLHPQYTAETSKQLPRGYAGASDHLRLDIIHLLGGLYIDGDNHLTNPARTLDGLLDAVAASPHGFTLHILPNKAINNDLIIAPARHPAIQLWRELARASYGLTQRQLFGGLD